MSIKHIFGPWFSCIHESPGADVQRQLYTEGFCCIRCTQNVFLTSVAHRMFFSAALRWVCAPRAAQALRALSHLLSVLCPSAVAERVSQAEEAERLHPTCPQRYCGLLPCPARLGGSCGMGQWHQSSGCAQGSCPAIPALTLCSHCLALPCAEHLSIPCTEKSFHASISLL